MQHPQIVRVNPLNIDEEVKSPVLGALIKEGWTIQSSVILQDPTKPKHDSIRLGLIMFPPVKPDLPDVIVQPEVSVQAPVETDRWVVLQTILLVIFCTGMLAALIRG